MVRPRPSMVLRYEACGGLFNQVCESCSYLCTSP